MQEIVGHGRHRMHALPVGESADMQHPEAALVVHERRRSGHELIGRRLRNTPNALARNPPLMEKISFLAAAADQYPVGVPVGETIVAM